MASYATDSSLESSLLYSALTSTNYACYTHTLLPLAAEQCLHLALCIQSLSESYLISESRRRLQSVAL